MPMVDLTDEQVVSLVGQLPSDQRSKLLAQLLIEDWKLWAGLSHEGQDGVRKAARQRGLHWDALTEDERELLIDDIVHEDR